MYFGNLPCTNRAISCLLKQSLSTVSMINDWIDHMELRDPSHLLGRSRESCNFMPALTSSFPNCYYTSGQTVHTEKSFRNHSKLNRNQIVIINFRLIWNQTDASVWFQINRKMVNTIWFRFDLIRFWKDFSACTMRR